jgi:cobalamin biosynthesis protein CobT
MGLLDDAIREHLELKRLRGADPGEVARLESEVLGPAVVAEETPEDSENPQATDHQPEDESPAHPEPDAAQETAELDMRSYLDEAQSPDPHIQADTDGTADSDQDVSEDVLEETPDFLQDTPEHERLWFEQSPPRDFDFDR